MVLTLAALLLSGCKSRAVEEAREVIAVADSLRAEGQGYTDSVAIAEAYNTLEKWQYIYPTDYVHACYHYGRLLRNNDDPVAAMQVFINGTHSRSKDYHILGRIYSNMGSISHLAGEYQLADDMYSRSADMFLKNADTLLYYYGLNNLAVECAVQGKKEETLTILNQIESNSATPSVLLNVLETKAELYLQVQQYDSAIYYSKKLSQYQKDRSTNHLICAQAYSYIGQKDSAIFYAKKVVSQSNSIYTLGNAYYMLTNDNTISSIEEIKEVAADRADILLEVSHQRSKLSQATQLLEQDLNKKPDYRWLYAILITLIIMGVGIYAYTSRKRRQHKLLSQEVDDIRQEKESLQEIHNLIVQEHNDYTGTLITQIQQNCIILRQSEDFPNNIYWKEFNTMSKIINDNFGLLVQKLHKIYHLQEKEIRLCILVLFDTFNSKQQAKLLFYSESGIRNFKNRVAKKLGTNSTELRDFLINLAINEHSKCI